jgi:adenosine deaminase
MPALLDANFENCIETGVKVVAPSITYRLCDPEKGLFKNDIDGFIKFLRGFKYDDLRIDWILNLNRDRFKPGDKEIVNALIKSKFFAGIDLSSTEDHASNDLFKNFYRMANDQNMITQVHAGEQLGADYVMKCIRDFNPKQIQHGISIIHDPQVMKTAKKEGITFNVCPSSNVSLGYAKSFKEHPIGTMYKNDLSLTIGTDDLLFFNSSVPQEYEKLLRCGILTAEQLEDIRKNSLRVANVEKETWEK